MMNVLLLLPLIIPLSSAAISLLAWRSLIIQRVLAVLSMAALLGAGIMLFLALWNGPGIAVSQPGDWPAPYGITLVADLFSAIMVILAGVMGLAVAVYSLGGGIDPPRESFGYYPLLHVLVMGVCGAFLTGDIFNLYVWFEVMLMASFVLLALGGERDQIRGAIKYVTLNLVASAFFLAVVGILYGMAGTLNMADLVRILQEKNASQNLTTTLSMLLLIAFGIKAAIFPLFFWLPASYHTPPVPVSAIFAGLLTKVGVYALIRVFTLLFVAEPGYTHGLILVLSGLTMVTGVLGATAQFEIRRILSFHIISQIGYMTMGLGLAGLTGSPELKQLALAASVFYIAHHIVVKTNLFLIAGLIERLRGTGELKKLGGLAHTHPMLAVLFLIPAMSLAGMPPLSGFFAKLALLRAALETSQYVIACTALVVGLLTLFSMTKIWSEVFWGSPPESSSEDRPHAGGYRGQVAQLLPVVGLATLTVLIGLGAEPVFEVATRAAEQLLDTDAYTHAVLGDGS